MKSFINPILLIFTLALLLSSCDRANCINKNPIFDKFDLNSTEYKTEIAYQLDKYGHDNFTYWFDSYLNEKGNEYIIINIQNDSVCAKAQLLVRNWNKIEGIKETKGKSYRGAKLNGLQIEVERDSNKVELVYSTVKRIID